MVIAIIWIMHGKCVPRFGNYSKFNDIECSKNYFSNENGRLLVGDKIELSNPNSLKKH